MANFGKLIGKLERRLVIYIVLEPALAISSPYIPKEWILNTKVRDFQTVRGLAQGHQPASAEGKLELRSAWL